MTRNTEHIGDVAVGRHLTVGGEARMQGSARVRRNLRVDGWLDAPNVKGPLKGLYADEAALVAAYPRPQPGWYALVGGGLPAAVYREERGAWVATGERSGEPTLALEGLEEAVDGLQGLTAGGVVVAGSVELTATDGGVTLGYDVYGADGSTEHKSVALPVAGVAGCGVVTAARLAEIDLAVASAGERADAAAAAAQGAQEAAQGATTLAASAAALDDVVEFYEGVSGIEVEAGEFVSEKWVEEGGVGSQALVAGGEDAESVSGALAGEALAGSVVYDEAHGVMVFRSVAQRSVTTTLENGATVHTLVDVFYRDWPGGERWGEVLNAYGRVPDKGKIYVKTSSNRLYRWGGSGLVELLGGGSGEGGSGDVGGGEGGTCSCQHDAITEPEIDALWSVQGATGSGGDTIAAISEGEINGLWG